MAVQKVEELTGKENFGVNCILVVQFIIHCDNALKLYISEVFYALMVKANAIVLNVFPAYGLLDFD